MPAEYVLAMFGKHDLNVTNEAGSKQSLVWEVIPHPDWNFNEERFDADISIAVLTDRIEFSNAIQPICLPQASYEEVVGTGTVAGWGMSEHVAYGRRHDSKLNQLVVPAVNSSHCYTTFYILGAVSSNRAFCGGYEYQGRAPCLGDSGGGFYLLDRSTSAWNVRGVISASILDFDNGCDINTFSIYTNVARFVDWIRSEIVRTRTIKWQFIEFNCVKEYGQGSTM